MASSNYIPDRFVPTANDIGLHWDDGSVVIDAPALPHINPANPESINYLISGQSADCLGLRETSFEFSYQRRKQLGAFAFSVVRNRIPAYRGWSNAAIQARIVQLMRQNPYGFGLRTAADGPASGEFPTKLEYHTKSPHTAFLQVKSSRIRNRLRIDGRVDVPQVHEDISNATVPYHLALQLWGSAIYLLQLEGNFKHPSATQGINNSELSLSLPLSDGEMHLLLAVGAAAEQAKQDGETTPRLATNFGAGTASVLERHPQDVIAQAVEEVASDMRRLYGDTGIMGNITTEDIIARLPVELPDTADGLQTHRPKWSERMKRYITRSN